MHRMILSPISFVRFRIPGALALVLIASSQTQAASPDPKAIKFFETKIRPILSSYCYDCHGEKKQKANLRLDNISYMLQGGDGGPAVVPGDILASHLIKAVTYEDADLQMPPDAKLEDAQIADLKKWIKLGAPWPESEVKQVKKPGEFTAEERAWWAFQPVKAITPPVIKPNKQIVIQNDIDKFVVDKLGRENLVQAPESNRYELVRRAYFDLHGLPPTPEQLKEFIDDKRPDAYERLIDQLLADQKYGERWAQHWLDLVRYAESDGYRQDAYRANAWPYRDYVVRSFNENKPYDRFVREQLAGDELDPENPDVLIGTTYIRNGIYEYNQRDAVAQRQTILNEIADTTGELFLGLSFGCARCHDHKFDPILQKDYYRLMSFFTPMQWRDDLKLATTEQKQEHAEQLKKWDEATVEARTKFDSVMDPKKVSIRKNAIEKFPDDVQVMVNKPDQEKTPYEKQITYLVERQVADDFAKIKTDKFKAPDKAIVDEALAALKLAEASKPKPLPVAFVATDVSKTAPPTIMSSRRGGEQQVEPGFLTLLAPDDLKITPPAGIESTGRRTALANWITRPDNPLSTRVIVNRVWQYHFGRGLVSSSSDFGKLGEKPSHPELLDWLAHEFVAHGWDIKWLHRQIMLSATYRQTARVIPTEVALKKDPENRWLWRMNPVRLDAEQARDTMLAISGELNPKMGGQGEEAARPRRTVYTRKIRNSQDDFLHSFDSPPGFQSVAKRDSTTTALQSLLMVNGEWPLQRAHNMAENLLSKNPPSEALVSRAYELAYSRPPSATELNGAVAFISSQETMLQDEMPANPAPSSPLVDSKEFFGKHLLGGTKTVSFHPGSEFEKLKVVSNTIEKDEFTVEGVVYLESIYPDASVRTIVSRWNNDKASKGWAFGVTSERSKYQPNNLIMQLCGDDFQGSVIYEVVASNIRIPLNTPYYVAAVISNHPQPDQKFGGTVTFYTRNLADPEAKMEMVTVQHPVVGGYANPQRALMIGGRDQDTRNLWDGVISRAVVSSGLLTEDQLLPAQSKSSPRCIFDAQPETLANTSEPKYIWEKGAVQKNAAASSARLEALADFCHVLMNSNEFLYLQ